MRNGNLLLGAVWLTAVIGVTILSSEVADARERFNLRASTNIGGPILAIDSGFLPLFPNLFSPVTVTQHDAGTIYGGAYYLANSRAVVR